MAKVFGQRILIRLIKPKTILDRVEKSGLALPEGAKEAHTPLPATGIVVMIGDGFIRGEQHDPMTNTFVTWEECPVEVGDMIMFAKYAGTDFSVDENDFRVLEIREVIAKLELADGSEPLEVIENE